MPDSMPVNIANGLGARLADLGLGTFHADGSNFTADEINVIGIGEVADSDGTAIGITPYPVSDNPGNGDGVYGFQIWFRSANRDPRTVTNMRETVFASLQGAQQYTLGGERISVSYRQITSEQGLDKAGRYQAADSYYFAINRPMAASFD